MTAPELLLAAHGTRSALGLATTVRLARAVATARPELTVSVAYLDVAEPTLRAALAASPGPTVVVPLLLSAGYHVRTDIPALARSWPEVVVARHLGPEPLVMDAVLDRLGDARQTAEPGTTLLARVPSTRAESDAEFQIARALLAQRLGWPVRELLPEPSIRAALAAYPPPVEIASYLLAEGSFFDTLRAAAAGLAAVAEPIGAHPALVELVLARYDDARR